jgi:hypothetical protein
MRAKSFRPKKKAASANNPKRFIPRRMEKISHEEEVSCLMLSIIQSQAN